MGATDFSDTTISIHAAREGGDCLSCVSPRLLLLFQSTPPVKAATSQFVILPEQVVIFQSTPPVKAATMISGSAPIKPIFQSTPPVKAATPRFFLPAAQTGISIHAAREGGDVPDSQHSAVKTISIHAAREGGDTANLRHRRLTRFQSTPPVKAATPIYRFILAPFDISIHAAREGGDLITTAQHKGQ